MLFLLFIVSFLFHGVVFCMEEAPESPRVFNSQANFVYLFNCSINNGDFALASKLVRNHLPGYQPAEMVRTMMWDGIKPGDPLDGQSNWDQWQSENKTINPGAFKRFLLFSLQEEFSVAPVAYVPMISHNYKRILDLKTE